MVPLRFAMLESRIRDWWERRRSARSAAEGKRVGEEERRIFERDARTSDRPQPLSAARQVVAKNLFDRVRAKLDDISPDKAYAFLLHDVLGFDLREIAQITSVSVAAAQQRLVRGRREVHELLAADQELASLLEDLEERP